jgi:hypothetical protein
MKTSILSNNRRILIAVFTFLSLLPISLLLAQGTPTTSKTYTSQDAGSTVTVGPVVNAKQLATAPSAQKGNAGAETHPRGFPDLRPPMQNLGPLVSQPAAITPLAASPDPVRSSFRGFTGLTHLEQRLYAANGNQFSTEPPDQGLAVGDGFVLEGVNCAINVYNTGGVQLLPRPLALTELFGLPPAINRTTGEFGVFVGDVSCLFDPETERWFVVAWAALNTPAGVPQRQSRLYLAVSQSSDPRGDYATYTFNTTGAADVDQQGPRIPDFPHFAVDRYGLFINWQEFKITPSGGFDGFIGTAILAISKDSLLKGKGGFAPSRVQRFAIPLDTGFEFRIWPAYLPPGQSPVLSDGGTEYFLSSNINVNHANHIAVWALTNTSSLNTSSPNLSLKMTLVKTQDYSFPDFGVPQKDGFRPLGESLNEPVETLDAGADTISSAEYVNGHVWGTLSSAMSDGNGNNIEVVDYFAFTPRIVNGVLRATLFTQGVVARPGTFLMYPALALNADENGAIVFSLSSPTNYPSAAFVNVKGTTVSPIHIARAGNEPDDGFTGYPEFGGSGVTRWGDYSAAAVDNTDDSIWMATEYIPDLARTVNANWATYIIRSQP